MKKVVLSLMAIVAMQTSIAGQETLNVTFSGEVLNANSEIVVALDDKYILPFDESISEIYPFQERVDFYGKDLTLVVAVQGEGAEYYRDFGGFRRDIGKTLMKAQSFNVSIPMMIEVDVNHY